MPLTHLSRPARAFPLSTLATAVLLASAGLAHADDSSTSADPQLKTVTVTTSATAARAQQRTITDSSAPIDIISNEALTRTGRAELSEAIAKLLPSFNFGSNIAGYNSTTRPLSFRGLGPEYTLVLVNGKRRHDGAAIQSGSIDNSGANVVDIDMIPVSSVDHIEVLKDAAAARYGSDAVAGVVNIVLKSQDSGGHVESSYGKLFSGQGATKKIAADEGFKLGDGGFLHLSADARKRDYASWDGKADSTVKAYNDPIKQASWDRVAIKNGDPELKAFNLGYNAELPLNDVTLYSFGTYGQRKAVIQNYYRFPNGTASVPDIYPNGYYPLNNLKDTDYQFVFGGKGEVAGWGYDLSTSYGRDTLHYSSDLNLNPSLGDASPTHFGNLATFRSDQWVNNLDFTRRFENPFNLGVPVTVSTGVEHKWERFSTFAGEADSYEAGSYPAAVGAQASVIIRPQDEVDLIRNTYATYLDLGFDLTSRWYADVAARVEHFDDYSGDKLGLKFNSRYKLTDTVAVRGTLGTGVRAPSLTQGGYTTTDSRVNTDANGNVVPATTRLTAADSSLAKALGGSALKPEKSQNAGLGLTWQPDPLTAVTADAYLVDIQNRIALTSAIYDNGNGVVNSILASQGVAAGTWVDYYTNAFDTRTRGLDVVADHTTPFAQYGDVRWSLGFNYNKTTIQDAKDTPASLASSGVVLVGRNREGDLTDATPKTKWILGANWKVGNWNSNLTTTRYGSVSTLAVNPSGDRSFGAKWITDLDVSYTFFDHLTVSLGGSNILDVRPDKNAVYSSLGLAPYGNPPFYPGGGSWYTKVAYDF
ncbi:TonB-dependent receptor [Pseudomonas sp. dw_358]|uniref:TonB-dependent receptor plug domain-containing protein n=1 Tax=Pseudomonas sp. dw_358 TaxID=2720083 RepID=UPI001BD47C9B|nr:TonB-dependent receptor [Pseudomonas sp. dw_358]